MAGLIRRFFAWWRGDAALRLDEGPPTAGPWAGPGVLTDEEDEGLPDDDTDVGLSKGTPVRAAPRRATPRPAPYTSGPSLRESRPQPGQAYDALVAELAPVRAALVSHPIYSTLTDPRALQVFMTNHVFAVWDFMSLLKALQRRLTCTSHPWLPSDDASMARLINEIVLGEETDEVVDGRYISHFRLYTQAMKQIGADLRPIDDFVNLLHVSVKVPQALDLARIPHPTAEFVQATMAACDGTTVDIAASFLLGREDLVPAMFRPILAALEAADIPCDLYRLYLDRHVQLDEEEHGPAARRLLEGLCGSNATHWAAAGLAARNALLARRKLWDGVLDLIELSRVPEGQRR